MAFLVNKPVALTHLVSVAARRNDSFHIPRYDGLDERIAVIAVVADKRTCTRWRQRQQGFGLSNITGLPSGQYAFEGIPQAQGIGGVNLGAKAALRSSQGYVLGVAAPRATGAGMSPVDGGIDKREDDGCIRRTATAKPHAYSSGKNA